MSKSVRPLGEQQASVLRAAPLSFTPFNDSGGAASSGYHHVNESITLTRRDFDGAARDLFAWQVHSRAGLRVQASDVPLRKGTVVLMRWGLGALSLKIPCRVLDVVDETRRRGFSYGTLPGHPEVGAEQFMLERLDGGRIVFTITAYSRPGSALAKLGGPMGRAAQRLMTERYLRALDRQ
ncbi:hypothetical protein JNB_15103 [Janibacter sp. HTCC2649]|uniref:DUF1990 family protein n=1 Tax=Janibacter sp. HTCC2649 TaxID=313589 RepID=UPI00006719E8|nr:DUF1990 domain-containing protein [Janibacter sp. HTCC2649]EAP98303.1 hypothetical protein JNB_15103 [Janibacter sp. HTCC2649]